MNLYLVGNVCFTLLQDAPSLGEYTGPIERRHKRLKRKGIYLKFGAWMYQPSQLHRRGSGADWCRFRTAVGKLANRRQLFSAWRNTCYKAVLHLGKRRGDSLEIIDELLVALLDGDGGGSKLCRD